MQSVSQHVEKITHTVVHCNNCDVICAKPSPVEVEEDGKSVCFKSKSTIRELRDESKRDEGMEETAGNLIA
ncbi:hypothetical protein K0M31_013571 [Melipona bicolor]|uniref:Uncharacterized protein n=1 Tax=Melipona bicolor TaxID=60889 RepID=A0AA40FHN6_9HYME|nr:hypothetical protein K0M31_013571 [Melipona bicolor]